MGLVNHLDAPVLLYEHAARGGRVLAEVRLHSAPTMNALTLEMIDLMWAALDGWAARSDVVAVLVSGAGERAFCAGADLRALYHAMTANHEQGEVVDDYPFRFFEREYRLDYRLHTYAKPVIAVGHGVVMGGGLGIFAASRYRVITDCARVAMPEVNIGLFPDAGLTWLMRSMPRHHALFLGVTGSHMNGTDTIRVGGATHRVAGARRDDVRAALVAAAWGDDADQAIESALASLPAGEFPEAELDRVPEVLGSVRESAQVVQALEGIAGTSPWIDRGIAGLESGCPTTVGIVMEQLARAPSMVLADTFRMEMTLATHCANNHDFAEGIRALMIDKDHSPRWLFDDVASLPGKYVQAHFVEPWPTNPLADL